ncbi:tetratricopeptide repeat protein [Telluribacter sp.]|uniref:tetratricopeptide repeat protein n=1 Tax=Telluribacter sp. TaxID=1978767 RepID=UPI002E110D34|nr:tetratricopeptide repeat protein [Telluribacter sp.]
MFVVGICYRTSAQDFRECQQIFERLLPIFNQSFEDNNPALLHTKEYRRELLELQKAYQAYHRISYAYTDSLQRTNNEAVLLALSGNHSKSLRLMESLDSVGGDSRYRYNRGLVKLLNKQYAGAREDFFSNTASKYSSLNTLVAYGQDGMVPEGINYAVQTAHGNTAGKWNYTTALLYKFNNQLELAVDELTAAIRQKDKLMAYRLQRGDILMRLHKDKRAVGDFEKVARQHPKAQIRYANALLSLNRFHEAKRVFEQYLEADERDFRGNAYLGLGHANYGLQQLTEAQRYYQLAASVLHEDKVALCGQGNVLISKHEYAKARNIFERIIQADSTYLSAFLGRALVHYGLKEYKEALNDFERAAPLLDENNRALADVFVSRGYSYYYTRQPAAAQLDFQRAIRLDGASYEALAGMSNILIDQRRYPEAGQYLSRALNYEKNYDRMWSNYGNLLLHFDMYSKSYDVFKKAVALNPANLKAQNGWGVVLLESDKLDKSIALFDSLIKENPTVPYLLNNRGIVQAYLGNRHEQRLQRIDADLRYQNAGQDFEEAMRMAPSRKFYNVNQGNVYKYWEKYDEARLSYKVYQDKSAINNTGILYAGMEKLKDAKYYLGVAIGLDSTHRVFQFNMSLLVKGKYKDLARAVASAKDDGPYSDIGIKYSRDGFVTIYLYDYEYDTLYFPGRHYLPLPVDTYNEDYFIPEYDFQLMPYEEKKFGKKVTKKGKYKSQKVNMPGRSRRSGTKCPIFF